MIVADSRSSSLVQVFQNDVNLTAKLDVTKPLAFVVHGWMDRFFSTFLYHDGLGWPVATVLGIQFISYHTHNPPIG